MIEIYFLLLLVSAGFSAKLPTTFPKCNRNESNFKTCVLKAAQDGISKADTLTKLFHLPSISPFKVSEINMGQGKGVVAVEQKFKDCEVHGLTQLKADIFEFDLENKVLKVVGTFPEIRKSCQYELDGKVLLLPIQGKGPSNIILKNLHVDALIHFDEVEKNKKHYMKCTNVDLTLEPGFISYDFGNLFNGDKALGDNVLKVLNDNWKEVFDDVQDGYKEIIVSILLNVFNNFFGKISEEELFD